MREEGPRLGLHLNPAKSTITGHGLTQELLERQGLGDLVLMMEGSHPAAVVLGHPMGPPPFVERMMASVLMKLRAYHKALAHVHDPQVELYLMRGSLGVCRVTHLIRGVPGRCLMTGLDDVDQLLRTTLERILGTALGNEAWAQTSLPLRLGGLGLTHSKQVAGAAFTASALGFAARAPELGLPPLAAHPTVDLQEAVASLPNRGAVVCGLRDTVAASKPLEVDAKLISQRFLSEVIHRQTLEGIQMQASARNLARLHELRAPTASAWLTPPPAKALGLTFEPGEFRALLKYRLGVALLPEPVACPRCGEVMDVYGDHALCCTRSSFVTRHQFLADALARVAAFSGSHVQREVAVAGRLRPADLLISGWGPRPVAIDVTLRHSLAEFDTLGSRLERAALSKHVKYDAPCRQAGLDFQVFALSTLGSAEDEATEILKMIKAKLIERYGKRDGREFGQQAVERLGVAAMRGVGASLIDLMGSSAAGEETSPDSLVRPSAPSTEKEYEVWAEEHGFQPAPPTSVPGSLGIRILATTPVSAGEAEAKRRLFWEDPALGARVWVRD